jgi:hypothetical protein
MSARLEHLRQNSRRIEAERIAFTAQISQAADRINDAAAALATAERDFNGNNDRIAPFRASLRKAKQDRAAITRPPFYDPLPEVEKWVARRPKYEAAEPVTPKLRSGENALQGYRRAEGATDTVLKRIRGIETAPAPSDQVRSSLAAQIRALAKAPQIVGDQLVLPKSVIPFGDRALTVVNSEGLLAWAAGDILAAAAEKLVPDDATAISPADRKAALDTAFTELVAAIRHELALAEAAEVAGFRVARRRGVHPGLLLGLRIGGDAAYTYLKGA